MKLSKLLAAAALVLSLAGPAAAAPIVGFAAIGGATITATGSLANGVTVNFLNPSYQTPVSGDFVGQVGEAVDTFSVTLNAAASVSFTSTIGSFTGSVVGLSITPGAFANVIVQGTFTPTLPGLDENTMEMRLTVTEITGSTWSGGGVIDSRLTIPEPMSLALFGLGLAGLGVAIRRRA